MLFFLNLYLLLIFFLTFIDVDSQMSLLRFPLILRRFYTSTIQQSIHEKPNKETLRTSKSGYLIPEIFELDGRKSNEFLCVNFFF